MKKPSKQNVFTLSVYILPVAVFLFFFGRSFLSRSSDGVLSAVLACAMALSVCCLYLVFASGLLKNPAGIPLSKEEGKRSLRRSRMHPLAGVFFAALLSRAIILLIPYGLSVYFNGYSVGFMDTLSRWVPAGSKAALMTAAAAGESVPASAFIGPVYPLLLRQMLCFFPDALTAGLSLSAFAFSFSACVLYEVALPSLGRDGAHRAVRYLVLLPCTLRFMLPDETALFLLFSLLAVLLLERRRLLPGGILILIATATNPVGILLLVPLLLVAGQRFAAARGLKAILLTAGATLAGVLTALAGLQLCIHAAPGTDVPTILASAGEGIRFCANAGDSMAALLHSAGLSETPWAFRAALFGLCCCLFPFALSATGKKLSSMHLLFYLTAYLLLAGGLPEDTSLGLLGCLYPAFLCCAALTEKSLPDVLLSLASLGATLFTLYGRVLGL